MELRIKEIIKGKGYTIKSLAEKMNINRVNLSNMINGNPTIETLEKIADALNVPITELFSASVSVVCPHCGKNIPLRVESITEVKE